MVEDGSDAALISASLAAPALFGTIFDRHATALHRYIVRRIGPAEAESMVGEVFRIAFEGRHAYDAARPDARPWLYGIATKVVAQHRRAERRRIHAMSKVSVERPGSFDDRSADRVTAEQLQPRLARALTRLSAAERDLLLLVAWADLTYEDAALALGVPVGTVRSRLHRLRVKVRRTLGGIDPFAEEPQDG